MENQQLERLMLEKGVATKTVSTCFLDIKEEVATIEIIKLPLSKLNA